MAIKTLNRGVLHSNVWVFKIKNVIFFNLLMVKIVLYFFLAHTIQAKTNRV